MKPWEIIADEMLDISLILEDVLDTENPKTVNWIVKNPDGTVSYINRPNLAMVIQTFQEQIDDIKATVAQYYTKEDIDTMLTTLVTDKMTELDYNPEYSYIVTEAENDVKLKYDTSGVIFDPVENNIDSTLDFIEPCIMSRHETNVSAEDSNSFYILTSDIDKNNSNPSTRYIINDREFVIKGLPGTDYARIPIPEPVTPLKEITNIKSIDTDINTGDEFILNDLTTPVLTSSDLTADSISYVYGGTSTLNSDGSFTFTKTTTDTAISGVHIANDIVEENRLIEGVAYKYRFKISYTGNVYRIGFLNESFNNQDTYVFTNTFQSGDYVEFTKICRRPNTNRFLYIHVTTENPDDTCSITVSDISVVQAEPCIVISNTDVAAGNPLPISVINFKGTQLAGRQDMIFLETWPEKISDKDIVYPYGNVQYTGDDIEGLTGIAEGTFTGADTYSLFGNWQTPGSIIGKGYKWSNLTSEERKILTSNKLHQIFYKNGEWYQYRLRVRAVKGPMNLADNFMETYTSKDTYTAALGYARYTHVIHYKGADVSIDKDVTGWEGYQNHYLKSTLKNNNAYHTDYLREGNALPIAIIQRHNIGCYHPVYNPLGSSKIYYSGNAYNWNETPVDVITSKYDCFKPENIAVLNTTDNTYISLSLYLTLDDKTNYQITGKVVSGVSGRPDNKYSDVIYNENIRSVALYAKTPEDEEIYANLLNNLVNNKIRQRTDGILIAHPKEREFTSVTATFGIANVSVCDLRDNYYSTYLFTNYSDTGFPAILYKGTYRAVISIKGTPIVFEALVFQQYGRLILHPDSCTDELVEMLTTYINNKGYALDIKLYMVEAMLSETYISDSRMLKLECLGNVKSLDDKVAFTTASGDLLQAEINKGTYVKADNNYYLSKTDRGTITIDPNVENYSDTTNWINLGTNGAYGAMPDMYDYSMGNVSIFSATKTNEYIDLWSSYLGLNNDYVTYDDANKTFTITLTNFTDEDYIYRVYVKTADNKYKEYILNTADTTVILTGTTSGNTITLNVNDNVISELGYATFEDFMTDSHFLIARTYLYNVLTSYLREYSRLNMDFYYYKDVYASNYSSDFTTRVLSNQLTKDLNNVSISPLVNTTGYKPVLLTNINKPKSLVPVDSSILNIPVVKYAPTFCNINNKVFGSILYTIIENVDDNMNYMFIMGKSVYTDSLGKNRHISIGYIPLPYMVKKRYQV